MNGALTTGVIVATALSVGALITVLFYVFLLGLPVLNWAFFTEAPNRIGAPTPGGVGPAIVGTLIQAAIGAAIAVPIGLLIGVWLSEYAQGRTAQVISFFLDMIAGMPSIVVGVLVWGLLVRLVFGSFNGFAGGVALSIIMVPIVARTVQEMLALVPMSLREASYALGVPVWKTIVRVVIPTARTGVITGIVLAVARAAGETAPLLLTSLGTQFFNFNPFEGPMASLPVQIYNFARSPDALQNQLAWGAAAVLIIVIAILNLLTRLAIRGKRAGR